MPATAPAIEENGVRLRLEPAIQMTDEQFFAFCQQNHDLRIERTAHGDIIVMPPAGGGTSNRNADLIFQLQQWAKKNNTGVVFDSSGGSSYRTVPRARRTPHGSDGKSSPTYRRRKKKPFSRFARISSSNSVLLPTRLTLSRQRCRNIWITAPASAG